MMWGVRPLPEKPDEDCAHCGQRISWRWESEEDGRWQHVRTRSIRCELFATPK